MPRATAAGSLAAIARFNYHEGFQFQLVRRGRRLFFIAGRSVPFMAVGTLVMKD
jgi:hypothetical protein